MDEFHPLKMVLNVCICHKFCKRLVSSSYAPCPYGLLYIKCICPLGT
jgi:hypothetical protein